MEIGGRLSGSPAKAGASPTPFSKSMPVVFQPQHRVATSSSKYRTNPVGPLGSNLIHFASHNLAFWKMNEELSRWSERAGLRATLFDQPTEWVSEIQTNIERELEHGVFRLRDKLGSVFGTTLGKARSRHVREALRNLEKDGIVAGPVKGRLDRFQVRKPEESSLEGPSI